MKILVTGIAGFIGSHLAERLTESDNEVIGIDCFTDYYSLELKKLNTKNFEKKGIVLYNLDLSKDNLTKSLTGVEVIFHLAAQPGISPNTTLEDYIKNNIVATDRLLNASKNLSSLECFINISTSSVYGLISTDSEKFPPKPTSYYGVTKLAAEQLVLAANRAINFPSCSLRIFSVYGPRERPEKLYPQLIRSILENIPFTLYEGSLHHSRSYTYVDDIIDGLIAVLENQDKAIGEIFNIGSNIEIQTGETIKIVEEILGKEAQKIIRPKRTGEQIRTFANIDKARKLLGYKPKTTIKDGLAAEIDWFKNCVLKSGIKY